MKNKLISLALAQGPVWSIYAPVGFALWQQVQHADPDEHEAASLGVVEQNAVGVQARAGMGEGGSDKPYSVEGGVAVLKLSGVMTKDPTSFGGCSTALLRRAVRMAGADPDVQSILMVFDSPGGSVSGTADLARDVAMVAARKTFVGYAQDNCMSAAMWVFSQCSGGRYANSTVLAGSVGTILQMEDSSAAYAEAGIVPKLYTSGELKGAGADGMPITEAMDTEFQRIVDTLNASFKSAIQAGCKVGQAQLKDILTARVYVGQEAVDIGLVQQIASLDDVLSSMRRQAASAQGAAMHQNNDFTSGDDLYVGSTLEQRVDSVCVAVARANAELTKAHTLRAQKGRTLGPERIQQVRKLSGELVALAETCEAFRDDSDPEAPAATAEPDTTTNNQAEAQRAYADFLAHRARSLGVAI